MKPAEVKNPGMYWAKLTTTKAYSAIAKVSGEFPFFSIELWNVYFDRSGIDYEPHTILIDDMVLIDNPNNKP